ncbi:MAG: hypothetical protein R3E89_16765 [Thiolinea sp.]
MQTFYWSQLISENSHADTDSLQAMAGVKTYIKLDGELRAEYQQEASQLQQLKAERDAAQQALAGSGVNQDYLPGLLDIRETLDERQQGSLALTGNIADVRENYTEQHGLFHQINSWSRKIGWLATLGVALAGTGITGLGSADLSAGTNGGFLAAGNRRYGNIWTRPVMACSRYRHPHQPADGLWLASGRPAPAPAT